MSDVEKWADQHQYRAEPHENYAGPEHGVMPKVTLLWMTPDPLGAVAAMAAMYEGRVVSDLGDLSHEDRMRYWADVRKTHLDTPLEAVQFHFMLEGVDRSFTHQLVRKRQAAYAQESLRFAVPGKLSEATTLPPSLQGTKSVHTPGSVTAMPDQFQAWRNIWEQAIDHVDEAYHLLVASGMPAEEARGLLPHCTATRANYLVNLRSLKQEAGNRLCTQAQFHWRLVMAQIVNEIRNYWEHVEGSTDPGYWGREFLVEHLQAEFAAIADVFKPVCYEMGRCPFKASFDRDCTIRERVDNFAEAGVESKYWDVSCPTCEGVGVVGEDHGQGAVEALSCPDCQGGRFKAIRPEEWLLNPGAARRTQ